MPGPILAALARLGAGLAARVGASGAARSLAGAARSGAAKAAQIRAAAHQAGFKGSIPEAIFENVVSKPAGVGPRVLENTKLNSARALYEAIFGGPTASPAGTQQTAASTAAQVANQTQQQATAAAPPASPPIPPPPAGGGPNTPPPSPGAAPGRTRPSQPQAQSWLDRAADGWQHLQARWQAMQERYTPVAQQVAGQTIDQRYERLKNRGAMPNIADVARQFSTPSPSREQIVQHGEDAEERQRQQEIQDSRWQRVGQAGMDAGKKAFSAAMSLANPVTALVKLPAAAYGVTTAFERLGRTIAETNRDLTRFDERIADSFARYDYAQLRSRQQIARATGGTASGLNDQLKKLLEELQPIRESVTTFLNLAGSSLVFIARAAALLVKWNPAVMAMMKAAALAERQFGKQGAGEPQAAAKDFLRDIRDGQFERPRNPPPRR